MIQKFPWGCGSVVKKLPSMHETLNLISNTYELQQIIHSHQMNSKAWQLRKTLG
jgi:hypothetical protein